MDRKLSNVVAGKIERDGLLYRGDVADLARRWHVTSDQIAAFALVYTPLSKLDRPLTDAEAERVRVATELLDGAAAMKRVDA